MTVEENARALRISRAFAYEAVLAGTSRTSKSGAEPSSHELALARVSGAEMPESE